MKQALELAVEFARSRVCSCAARLPVPPSLDLEVTWRTG